MTNAGSRTYARRVSKLKVSDFSLREVVGTFDVSWKMLVDKSPADLAVEKMPKRTKRQRQAKAFARRLIGPQSSFAFSEAVDQFEQEFRSRVMRNLNADILKDGLAP